MTKKLFWENAYLTEFTASVTKVNGPQVLLDQTAFNPRGGGLVGDTGRIEGVRVADTLKGEGDEIIHLLEYDSAFKIGDTVHGRLDWDRRHRLMRMHTAAHLLSAVFNNTANAMITGNQIEPEKSRVDFSLESSDRQLFDDCCAKANEIIKQDLPIKIYFLKREEALKIPNIVKLANAMPPEIEDLRIVEIGDVDIQADGGPHVKRLSEIGRVEILKIENKGKNNKRVYYTLK